MKPFKEVIDGIRKAVMASEVREDIAQGLEYVEQSANTAGENIKKAIDPTLSVSGKAADAAKVGEAVGQLKEEKINKPEEGDNNKIARAKNGEVEWVDVGQPTDEQTAGAVTKWLNKHPEATTTVQEGAIVEKQINPSFLPWIKKDYVTPEMFGAVGDGEHDDTDALRKAIKSSNDTGVPLLFPANCKCAVSDSLNIYDSKTYDVTLNIIGILPDAKSSYNVSSYGGIIIKRNNPLFRNAKIYGSIKNMNIVGKRDETYHVFDNCDLFEFVMSGCTIANVGAFLYDSGMASLSRINNNRFISVFYFHRYGTQEKSITDSCITNNYINGGQEPIDNACFEFQNGNGSTIQGNFVDYYNTIFRPKPIATCQLPTSIGNQYQVFLYFYEFNPTGHLCSIGDTFNWTDENKLAKLKTYKKRTYDGKDGGIYEIPSYIFNPKYSCTINIENAYIQDNIGNIVFLGYHIGEYETANFNANFVGTSRYRKNSISLLRGDAYPYYNAGNYSRNIIEPYFIEEVDELPKINIGWCKYPAGYRIRYNNQNYRMINKFNQETNTWEAKWIETDFD